MISDLEIIKAFKNSIASLYSDFSIYLDQTKEGFKAPAVFLKTTTNRMPSTNLLYTVDTSVYISVLLKQTAPAADLYRVQDKLQGEFWNGIYVTNGSEKRWLHTNNISSSISGADSNTQDILTVTARFIFYDSIPKIEPSEKIKNIVLKKAIKENE